MKSIRAVLCIPGYWESRKALVESIALDSEGFIFAGLILMNVETSQHYELQVESHIPSLKDSFEAASGFAFHGERLSTEVLQQIHQHKHVAYILADVNHLASLHGLIDAGIGLLNAGGIAIKVESTGVAHTVEKWQSFRSGNKRQMFDAFVTLVWTGEIIYSVGMHHFGLRDGVIRKVEDVRKDYITLAEFLMYVLFEEPDLEDNHTFSVSLDAPIFRLRKMSCETYPPDDLFHNPYGMWQLNHLNE